MSRVPCVSYVSSPFSCHHREDLQQLRRRWHRYLHDRLDDRAIHQLQHRAQLYQTRVRLPRVAHLALELAHPHVQDHRNPLVDGEVPHNPAVQAGKASVRDYRRNRHGLEGSSAGAALGRMGLLGVADCNHEELAADRNHAGQEDRDFLLAVDMANPSIVVEGVDCILHVGCSPGVVDRHNLPADGHRHRSILVQTFRD